MLPGKLAQDYFSNKLNEDINSGSSSDPRWDKMINPMSTKSEFVCFDFYISWNNIGNAYFESSQIQLSSFDQAMSQITIMIQYNDFHCETLELSIQPKIHEVSSLEDPIAKKDRIVSSFLKGKPFGKVRKYFYKDLSRYGLYCRYRRLSSRAYSFTYGYEASFLSGKSQH